MMNDLISRQSVLDIVDDLRDRMTVEGYCAMIERVKALPSAQSNLDRVRVSDLMEKIYSIQSVHLSVEGVLARKYFCEELWKEIFGSEAELPAWLR